jgi:hypothetical protein
MSSQIRNAMRGKGQTKKPKSTATCVMHVTGRASSSNAYRNQAHLGKARMIALVPQAESRASTVDPPLIFIRVIVSFFQSSLPI